VKNIKLIASIIGLIIFGAQAVPAQNIIQQRAQWFTYFGQYKFNTKWGIHTDIQFRTDEKALRVNQNLVRVGIQYYPTKQTSITLGVAHTPSFNKTLGIYVPENRIWEQFIYNQNIKAATMTHRVRLEQRFIHKYALNSSKEAERCGTNTGQRLRYFNRTLFNLTPKDKKNVLYLALQDEVFFNISAKNINPNFFDQNRLLLAVGVWYDHHTRLELGYMNQYIHPKSGDDIDNHIVHLSILQVLNFAPTK